MKLDRILDLVSYYNQVVSRMSLFLLARFISDTLNITIGSFCALVYLNLDWVRAFLETCNALGFFLNLLNFVINLDQVHDEIKSLSVHLLEIEYQSEDNAYNR